MPDPRAVTIRPVELSDRKLLREFIKLPWRIYRGDRNWVPPLIFDHLQFFNPRKNPYLAHSRVQLFLAYRDGRPVGRISAHENRGHTQIHRDGAGFFGFFECQDDHQVAAALFQAAEAWLREQSFRVMRGPVSFSMDHEVGLLVEGFGEPPMIRMTYNPPYYLELIEAQGFRKVQDLYAYRLLSRKGIPEAVRRAAEFALEDPELVVRPGRMKDFEEEKLRIKEVYAKAWSENWGAVPLTDGEFEHLARELKLVLDPELTFIAEYRGKPVGMSLVLPDMNQILRRIDGRLFPLGLLKLLLQRRRIDAMRVPLMGVLKGYRQIGIDAVFYLWTYERGVRKGYRTGELSWILESNTDAIGVLEKLGAERYKTYRIYDRPLEAGSAGGRSEAG